MGSTVQQWRRSDCLDEQPLQLAGGTERVRVACCVFCHILPYTEYFQDQG